MSTTSPARRFESAESVSSPRLLDGVDELTDARWRAFATDGDPFVSREFLGAAERSGAAGETMGWRPMHLVLGRGEPRGLLPLFRRDHSFGDFSRDWNWESAWRRSGLRYYPKLVSGVPYTPSPGPRLLGVRGGPDVRTELITAAIEAARACGASSWQCLFVRESDREALADAGLLMRRGVQFHWRNRGYRDFDDFLGGFTADKRKKVRRERRAVAESGIHVEARHGDEMSESLWAAVHRQYRETFERYGNYPAFPVEFFREAGPALGHRMVVFVAYSRRRPVASAICYRNEATLYGRHWGCSGDHPGLHFELCYYQGIEYAIAQGLERFEAGSGGEHKLARGFEPTPTWSAYWIADPAMREAVARFIEREDEAMLDYEAETAERLPYRAGA